MGTAYSGCFLTCTRQVVTKDRQSARDGKTRIGYDPRHRPWYWQCEQARKTIVTPPYIDATTDELVITVASPVYDKSTNKLLAVIGYDVSIARLANLILSAKSCSTAMPTC